MPTNGFGSPIRPAQIKQTRDQSDQRPGEASEHTEQDQWFFARVFEDLHMYFKQKNTIEYTNPLTNKEWKCTPPISLVIGGRELTVVAGVTDEDYLLSPISFFVSKCDGIPIGRLFASDMFNQNSEMEYEIEGVSHDGIDFAHVTGDELHVFADNLTQYLLNNPTKNVAEKTASIVGAGLKSTAKGVGYLVDEGLDRGIIQGVATVACIGTVIGGVIWGVSKIDIDSSNPFYNTQRDLPVAAAINPNISSFSNVQVVSDAEIEKLKGASAIENLDEIEFSGSELETTFEEQLQDEENTGKIFKAQIPSDGHCNLMQTLNIPNGTVRMIQSDGAPQLIVRIQRVEGQQAWSKYSGYYRADEMDDSEEVVEITQAQVCNPADSKGVSEALPAKESAYIEFTKLAPSEFSEVGR